MALLTAEEKAKLAEEGIGYGVKEKCDVCHKPILSPVSFIKKKLVLCAGCATGHDLVLKNTKEENKMAIKKAEKKAAGKEVESKKVGGYLIAGSALADLYEFLEDEKRHMLSEAKKICAKHKKDLPGRLGNLRRVGEKKKAWSLIVDDTHIQMKLGTPPKKEKAEKKSKKEESDDKEPVVSKALKATALLIRRTLKTGKAWTKNKLIEELSENGTDAKRIEAALSMELKAGGIEKEGGFLILASS